MHEAAMQKGGGQQSHGALKHLGHAVQAVVLRPAGGKCLGLARVKRLPRRTPLFVLLVFRLDDFARQQIAPEFLLMPHKNVQLAVFLLL